MRRRQKKTAKQTVSHRENAVFTDKLKRSKNALINMSQTAMADK